ncbi:MAG: DUF4760 domain-containing protein [Candidatus Nanoarchaeia archaeon]|jgi:hypothetical protein
MSELIILWFSSYEIFSEQIIALSTFFLGVIGFIYTIKSINNNTESGKTSLLQDMCNEERDLSLKLFSLAKEIKNDKDKKEMVSLDNKIKENDLKHKEEKLMEQDVLISQYLNFLEHLSLLINSKKIDEKLAKRYWGKIIKQAESNYKQKIFPDYTEFIILYNKWK